MDKILIHESLQTIIVCSTVVIVSLIAVSAYRISKNSIQTWGSYIFSASILLILAVAIFSFCFCSNRNVLDFISLASALISIILAVVTIIYSYFINSRSSEQIDQLNKAADNVSQATLSYANSAESLQENIQKIIGAINRVEEKTDRILNANATEKLNQNNGLKNFDLDKYIEGFVNIASDIGVFLLYACVKAKDCTKPFDLNELGESNAIYCYGFFVATVCTGIINGNIDFDNKKITIDDYIPKLKTFITKWINKNQGKSEVKEVLDKIDKYYS
jgi:ABC-type multidrug transport system fused ATPase/permease subunit